MLGSVAMLLIGYLARKYIIPFLKVGKRRRYAEYIALIADEVTDELRAKYPDVHWVRYLDEAVDQLAAICEVSTDIARRAVIASTGRK